MHMGWRWKEVEEKSTKMYWSSSRNLDSFYIFLHVYTHVTSRVHFQPYIKSYIISKKTLCNG